MRGYSISSGLLGLAFLTDSLLGKLTIGIAVLMLIGLGIKIYSDLKK